MVYLGSVARAAQWCLNLALMLQEVRMADRAASNFVMSSDPGTSHLTTRVHNYCIVFR